MTPQGTFEAFWSALDRRAWREAADLVHPDDAARQQREDLNMIGACLAANDRREATGEAANGLVVLHKPGVDLTEGYRERPVATFPGTPLLAELASLRPNVYLACSFAAQAMRGERDSGPRAPFPHLEFVGTLEDSPDLAHVEFRIPEIKEEDEDPVHRVSLRRYGGTWRMQLELGAFSAPLPWAGEQVQE